MIKRINQLSIGNSIFIMTMLIVGLSMMAFSIISYRIIFSRTDDLIESTSKEINKQVILNYESYLSNVIDSSNALQKYIADLTKTNQIEELNSVFETTSSLDKNIRTVALFDNLGNVVSISSEGVLSDEIRSKDWFQNAIDLKDIHHFSSPHIEDIFDSSTKEVFTISKFIQYYKNGVQTNGVLAIDIDTEDFKTLATMTNLGTEGHIVITDEKRELIYSSESLCSDDTCESVQVMNDLIIGGALIKINHLNMYVNVNTIKYTRWNIATFINVDEITNTKFDMLLTIMIVFGATMIIIALTSAALSKRITGPLNKLENHIKKIEQGDFDSMITLSGQYEVVLLSQAFNSMSEQIRELMNRVMKEQREKRKTQFIALQNQINPHFLYNTLDSIVWLSENKRNADVEKAIIALSKFFRMSISGEDTLVNLRDEIEHVSNYLLIQQIRYHNSFHFDFEIQEEALDCKVLKFSLQPLVENAITHGLLPEESYCHISIRGYLKDNYVYLEVQNEGYGISSDRIDEIQKIFKGAIQSTSIGLRNIYQRLTLYYGKNADMFIESELDEYTKVTIKMPIDRGEIK